MPGTYYNQGRYECIIRGQGFDVSREKKTPFFWLSFLPLKLNGELIDPEPTYERTLKLYMTEKTIERVVKNLRQLGWTGSSFRELEPGGYEFTGTNVSLICEHQDGYEDWRLPSAEVRSVEHRTGMTKKLDALFGANLKGGKHKPTTPQPVAAPVAVSEEEEDDCPF